MLEILLFDFFLHILVQPESEASNSDNICKNCSESFTLAIELKQHEKICQSAVVDIEMTRTPTPKELSPR